MALALIYHRVHVVVMLGWNTRYSSYCGNYCSWWARHLVRKSHDTTLSFEIAIILWKREALMLHWKWLYKMNTSEISVRPLVFNETYGWHVIHILSCVHSCASEHLNGLVYFICFDFEIPIRLCKQIKNIVYHFEIGVGIFFLPHFR